jgi:Arc/MetJ-type ribon-helix-helix transcriptional regulator
MLAKTKRPQLPGDFGLIGIKMIMGGIISSIVGSIFNGYMKISVSLSQELVEYIDRSVDNRSKLIESLLLNWQKSQQRESMVSACLALDEQQLIEEEEWQQAAITDWEVSG